MEPGGRGPEGSEKKLGPQGLGSEGGPEGSGTAAWGLEGWGPEGGGLKFRAFFALPPEISFFLLSLGVFSWNFGGV